MKVAKRVRRSVDNIPVQLNYRHIPHHLDTHPRTLDSPVKTWLVNYSGFGLSVHPGHLLGGGRLWSVYV